MTLPLLLLTHAQELLAQTPPPAAPAPAAVPWQTTMAAIGTVSSAALAAAVAVVASRRERKARQERDKLSNDQAAAEHRRPASLVSAWVNEDYLPNPDGQTYMRGAAVHIANEGDQPVFDVSALVGVGFKTRSIGPLAVPNRIPVLPPRRELVWDITLPLLAHPDTESPCAALTFTDSAGASWTRHFDGSLEEVTGKQAQLIEPEERDLQKALAQLGDLNEPYNPMTVAFAFVEQLQKPAGEFNLDEFSDTLAPEAPGWQRLTVEDVDRLRDELIDYSFGTMPFYAVPHVAYVKLIHDPSQTLKVVAGKGSLDLPGVKHLTLTFAEGRGWRVFGVGDVRVPVERILFPPGTLAPPAEPPPSQAGPRRWRRRRQNEP